MGNTNSGEAQQGSRLYLQQFLVNRQKAIRVLTY